ncbi:T9SS type A sorting domain-containing protein [Flammeovirga pacifica]|uniref:Uncharacterized protein n=1 Tax=Flammeovirga pacifica TaxID=915059 RepID=A0A1S1YV47_FLAPC|nr:T9SS type A sorting domain-containing protein [Flammeovirga pacifica]OHX64896.1 hypothetical protein NH26_00325 [Flammeovirga pacifica]
MENTGKGYMYVDKTELKGNTNNITSSYSDKKGFIHGEAYNNNFTFKATSKGTFETFIQHQLERGQNASYQLKLIGHVLSPIVKASIDGKVLSDINNIQKSALPYQTHSFDFLIENKGDADLVINGVQLEGNNVSEYKIQNSSSIITIPPTTSQIITLQLTPDSIGTKEVKLTFLTSDIDQPSIEVNFSTIIEAASISFEDVDGNEFHHSVGFDLTASKNNAIITDSLYIKNRGNKTLNITDIIEVNDPYHQLSFDYTNGTIAPNERQKVKLVFSPNGHNYAQQTFPIDITSDSHQNKKLRLLLHAHHQFHEAELNYNGNIVSTSYPIDFDLIDINKGKTINLLVKNEGTLPLEVKSVGFEKAEQSSFSIVDYPKDKIAIGSYGMITLMCPPNLKEQYLEEVLIVTSNDYQHPIQKVKLIGSTVKSYFYMSNTDNTIAVWNGDIKEYGPLHYEQPFEYNYVIQNKGNAPLRIDAIVAENNNGFDIHFSEFELPLILEPSEKKIIKMTASPLAPGVFNTKVNITTDEPFTDNFSYTVRMNVEIPKVKIKSLSSDDPIASIDFTSINSYKIQLKNEGTDILELNDLAINNNDFTLIYDENITFLRPQETLGIEIKYHSKVNEQAATFLTIKTNDLRQQEINIELIERAVTSIHDDLNDITIFPIPATNTFTINGLESLVDVKIIDLSGAIKKQLKTDGVVSVQNLQAGFYLVEIDHKLIKKIIIE